MKNRPAIRINSIWRSKRNNFQLIVHGKKGDRLKTKVLTDKPGVYAGTHSMLQQTLWRKYEQIT